MEKLLCPKSAIGQLGTSRLKLMSASPSWNANLPRRNLLWQLLSKNLGRLGHWQMDQNSITNVSGSGALRQMVMGESTSTGDRFSQFSWAKMVQLTVNDVSSRFAMSPSGMLTPLAGFIELVLSCSLVSFLFLFRSLWFQELGWPRMYFKPWCAWHVLYLTWDPNQRLYRYEGTYSK